jgi:hypothetical protein
VDAFVALVFVSAFALCELGIILILLSRPKKPTMSVSHVKWPQDYWPGGRQGSYE